MGDLSVQGGRWGRDFADVLVGHRDGGVTDKRWAPDQQLIEQAAGGIDISAIVDGLAAGLLRG